MMMMLSALYWLPGDSVPFSVWLHNKPCSWTTLIFLRPLSAELLPKDGDNGKQHISSTPGYAEDPFVRV